MSELIQWAQSPNPKGTVASVQRGSWKDLAALVTTHQVAPNKDGSGWLPSDIKPGRRAGERVKVWNVLVLDVEAQAKEHDGKKHVTGPLPPALRDLATELELRGWACCLATSHRHEAPAEGGTLGPRYRVVFRLSRPITSAEIKPLGQHVVHMLGLGDCTDTSCLEPARFFYMPRAPKDREHLAERALIDGSPLDVDALLAQAKAAQAAPARRVASATGSVIDAFNDQADIGTILEQHGYEESGRNRWIWPGSTTGTPGVHLLPESGRVYSHHPADPLAGVHSHDAFSAWCVLAHGGDMRSAVKEAARIMGMQAAPKESLPAPSKQHFKLLTAADLHALPPHRWAVHGVFPETGLAGVLGASTAGKTFVALTAGLHIALGLPWFGHNCRKTSVVYVGLEGERGIQKRVRALERHHGVDLPDNLRFVLQAFNMLDAENVGNLAAAILEVSGPGGVIIVDTLNRATPGADENSAQDMSLTIEAAKALQSATNSLVLLVHHLGKDASRGARGHSSLYAALDSAITVSNEGLSRSWTTEAGKGGKSKDGEAVTQAFELLQVDLGLDDDGLPITSAVAIPVSASAQIRLKPLTARQSEALESYRRAAELHGSLGNRGQFEGLSVDEWRPEFYRTCTADTQHAKKVAFQRMRTDLVTLGRLTADNDVYRLAGVSAFEMQAITEILTANGTRHTDGTETAQCAASHASQTAHTGTGVYIPVPCAGAAMGEKSTLTGTRAKTPSKTDPRGQA